MRTRITNLIIESQTAICTINKPYHLINSSRVIGRFFRNIGVRRSKTEAKTSAAGVRRGKGVSGSDSDLILIIGLFKLLILHTRDKKTKINTEKVRLQYGSDAPGIPAAGYGKDREMKRKLYIASFCIIMMGGGFLNLAQGVLLSDYIAYYSIEASKQGLMTMFQCFGCIAACLFNIALAGKAKKEYYLPASAGLAALCMFLIGTKVSFPVFLFLYFMMGFGYGLINDCCAVLSARYSPGSPIAIGFVQGSLGFSGIIAPIILRSLLKVFPWNLVCIIDSLIVTAMIAVHLVILLYVRSDIKAIADVSEKRIQILQIVPKLATRKNTLLLMTAAFCFNSFLFGMNTWITRFSDLELNVAGLGALMFSLFWVGNTISRSTETMLPFRPERLFCIGSTITAAAMLAGFLSRNAVVMMIAVLAAGLTSGGNIPLIYHMGNLWNPEERAQVTSLLTMLMYLSTALTASVTAALTKSGIIYGMLAIVGYDVLGILFLLPEALKPRANAVDR